MACSLARTLDIAGEWWTPLVVRDIWMGRTRFDEIQSNLGVSRKLLTDRLETLVREDVLERVLYQERPERYEYVLSAKGKELAEAFMPLIAWGNRWTSGEAGPPSVVRHELCGEHVTAEVTCSHCGELLRADEVRLEPGPGARIGRGTRPLPRPRATSTA
jgi:DNA-binding HxlR family transcriptional regulator